MRQAGRAPRAFAALVHALSVAAVAVLVAVGSAEASPADVSPGDAGLHDMAASPAARADAGAPEDGSSDPAGRAAPGADAAAPDAHSLVAAAFPRATMTCDRASGAGRVRCEVEARTDPGDSIAWGDVILLRLPPFAEALRGRIGPDDALVREPGLWRWTFAVVAHGKGSGDLNARVRAVVCAGTACVPREVEVAGRVDVGP